MVSTHECVGAGTHECGSCDNVDFDKSGGDQNVDSNVLPCDKLERNNQVVQQVASPPMTAESPTGVTPPTTKGYGLRKWRRIKRDFVKEGSANLDASKILKRGFAGSGNQTRPLRTQGDTVKDSEGSVGSTSVIRNMEDADGHEAHSSTLESSFGVGPAFAVGADSDNSEDRSSKSSTAASKPKGRYESTAAFGSLREKNRMKNLSGKSRGNSSQRAQQGKDRTTDGSKKLRGDRVKIQKENSHSSVESDLRSSSSVFMQSVFSTTSNGRKNGIEKSSFSANSDEAHQSGRFSEEVQTGYPRENVEVENLSQDDSVADLSWMAEEEKSENQRSSSDQNPLVESINALQSLQEALEKEVQKFSEIHKDPISLSEGSTSSGAVPPDHSDSEKISQNGSGSLENQITSLTENVKILEAKLEETMVELKVKESRVSDLEDSLNRCKLPHEGSESALDSQQEACKVMEMELEGLFKQKIEVEVEYLAVARTIQKLKVDAQSLMLLNEEEYASASKVDSKAAALKKQADDLERACEDIIVAGEVSKLRKGACKVTTCFFIQLALFFLVFWWFILQISPHYEEVVPT